MRRCQLSNLGVRRACLTHEAGRPVICRRDFHAAVQHRKDDSQPTTEAAPRTRRASSAAAALDIQSLPKSTEYSRYFRKAFTSTPSDNAAPSTSSGAPRQVVFRGARSGGNLSAGGSGRGGMQQFGRGGARGGAAAGRGAAAAGRGARGGSTRGGRGGRGEGDVVQRRVRGMMQAAGGEEDGEFEEDPMDASPQVLLEDNPIFETEPEVESYITLMELVEGAEARYTEADDLATKAEKENDREMSREADRATQRVDDDVRTGLAQLEATQNMVRPRHQPQEVSSSQFARDIGSVPVGSGGMGHVVEDGLRLLAKREGHEWEHPRAMAERLVAGEFVKFRNLPEKRDVLKAAGELGLEGSGGAKVLFAPLDQGARTAVVERLVKGWSGDSADTALKGDVLRNIARLTNGNPTIPGDAKATLLRTVQSLLPAERPVQASRPSKRA